MPVKERAGGKVTGGKRPQRADYNVGNSSRASDDDSGDKGASDVDDDDDSDEEEEEEEEEDSRRKRRRKSGGNQFIDVEAEVDDEDEDDEDDDLEGEDGFVAQSDDEEVGRVEASAHRRHANRTQERFSAADAQEMAEEMREKYGRQQGTFRGDTDIVPQRLLLPSVHDPSIFGVNARIGKEKEAVRVISQRIPNMRPAPEVFSCFQRDAFPGRIYIEARNQRAVLTICKGIPNIYANSKILLVPIKEYPDLLTARKSQEVELVPGTYVRVRRGKYVGDLAVVENLAENGLEVQLRLVPRLDYGRAPILDSSDNKRKRQTDRPLQRLFSAADAKQYDSAHLQRQGASAYSYAGDDYVNGYLVKDFKLTMVTAEQVNPSLEEIAKLNANSQDGGIDLQALSESVRKDLKVQTFQPGETVEVSNGELSGMRGRVQSTTNDIVTIIGVEDKYKGVKVNLPVENFRKYFNLGDHVRVTAGNYKDDTGMVVSREKDQITLLSDLSKSEVTVFAKDLKMASDIGGSNTIGKYALHDLIQLNAQTVGCIVDIEREHVKVLAQDGQILQVSPSSIIMKVTAGRNVATDSNGRQIEIGDTVRETGGERRQGSILHIYHSFIFLHNREITENLGVFVNRISNIATVATKGARDDKGLNLSKMNPMVGAAQQQAVAQRSFVNSRRIIGQRVSIGSGSGYKGLKGLVKDVNDTQARIELEARNKVITVPVDKLLFNGPNNTRVPFKEFIFASRGPRTNMQPPAFGGPGGPGGGFGGGPGGPGGFGSRNGGDRTPAPKSWNSGNKTPAYGGRQPAWNAPSGSRTPWSSGSKTPAYSGSGAGESSSWNSSTSWGSSAASAPTPGAYSSAPTPGAAATPGVYESAPTPYKTPAAMSAETPAAWGSDDEDEIKYEPDTP